MVKREINFDEQEKAFRNPLPEISHEEVLEAIRKRETFFAGKKDEAKFLFLLRVMKHLSECRPCRIEASKIISVASSGL